MNNYEDWAQLVAKNLKGEGDLIAAIDKDELDDAAATEAFVRAVLEPFLPESFGIGQGRVVDSAGNYSDYLDIIVYNHDYPGIGLRGTHSVYLYESVLAVFSIRAKLVRKSFFDALTSCASVADLKANIDKLTLAKMAKKNGLMRDSKNRFVHRDPLHTARFNMLGRPPSFIFGFVGMKQSHRQLQENIELWLKQRRKADAEVEMKSLPAVIATQGCFAWRNAAPLALNSRDMLGIGQDSAPVRLIILQLLYLLNRRLGLTGDAYGIKPSLKSYLNQFSPPHFEAGAGNIAEVKSLKAFTEVKQENIDAKAVSQRLKPARERARTSKTADKEEPDDGKFEAAKQEALEKKKARAKREARAKKKAQAVKEARARKEAQAMKEARARKEAQAEKEAAARKEAQAKKEAQAEKEALARKETLARQKLAAQQEAAIEPSAENQPEPAVDYHAAASADHGTLPELTAIPEPRLETPPEPVADSKPEPEPEPEPAPPAAPPLGAAPIPMANEKPADAAANSMPLPEAPEQVDASAAKTEPAAPPAPALGAAPIPMANGAPAGNADDTMPVPMLPENEVDDVPEIEPVAKPAEKAAKDSALRENTLTEIIPPKPPVDIELFGEPDTSNTPADDSPSASPDSIPTLQSEAGDTDFDKTVVTPPPSGGAQEEDSTSSSTDAFIARVKQQLASGDPFEDPDKDPYASTIPH